MKFLINTEVVFCESLIMTVLWWSTGSETPVFLSKKSRQTHRPGTTGQLKVQMTGIRR